MKKVKSLLTTSLALIFLLGSMPVTILAEATDEGNVKVTKTAKEVEGEKNVWEVEMKLEGENLVSNRSTDIVLVLDRSGSMKDTTEGGTRAKLVAQASKDLVSELVKQENVNVAVVSFAGGQVTSSRESYEHYYANTWTLFQKQFTRGNWYTNVRIDQDFTNISDKLNSGITTALSNPTGGTPIALGIVKAGTILEERDAKNKVIILLSDGKPTNGRDGSGNGNEMTQAIKNDTISAATQAKDKKIKIYTIAAGSGIDNAAKTVLEACASEPQYAYQAADTAVALKGVMDNIAKDIKETVNETVAIDILSDNFQIELTDDINFNKVRTIDYTALNTTIIDWNNVNAVITQGELTQLDSGQLNWKIGEIKQGIPAIIRYRVRLTKGDIGVEYPVSDRAELVYTNSKGEVINKAIGNITLKATWAGLDVNYYQKTDTQELELVKADGTPYDAKLWMKIPDTLKSGEALKVSPNSKVNPITLEIDDNGSTTIRKYQTFMDFDFIGVKMGDGTFNRAGEIQVTAVYSPMNLYYTASVGCNCSSVLGRATGYMIGRNRFTPTARYSQANFKDDIREGIYDAIKHGSNYEQQLARFEINYLLNVFGKQSQMAIDGVTNAKLITDMNTAINNKYNETNNWIDACTAGSNYWNNNIVKYIDFGKEFITEDDYKDILLALGIGNIEDKNLANIERQLKHVHVKDSEGHDLRPCTTCGNTVCALHNQPPQNIINESYNTYPGYVIAKLVSISEIQADSNEIKVGVEDDIVAECTCRLGAIPMITAVDLDVTWGEASNFIQPQGVTNIGVDVTFSEYSRNVSLKADISTIKDLELAGDKLMNYNLSKATVQVKDLTGTTPVVVDSSKYTFDKNTLTVTFNTADSSDAFYVEKDSKYRIMFYIPTTMGTEIQYNKTTANPTNNYIEAILKDPIRKQVVVPVTLEATARVSPRRLANGVWLEEVYNPTSTIVSEDINLNFIEIANIY